MSDSVLNLKLTQLNAQHTCLGAEVFQLRAAQRHLSQHRDQEFNRIVASLRAAQDPPPGRMPGDAHSSVEACTARRTRAFKDAESGRLNLAELRHTVRERVRETHRAVAQLRVCAEQQRTVKAAIRHRCQRGQQRNEEHEREDWLMRSSQHDAFSGDRARELGMSQCQPLQSCGLFGAPHRERASYSTVPAPLSMSPREPLSPHSTAFSRYAAAEAYGGQHQLLLQCGSRLGTFVVSIASSFARPTVRVFSPRELGPAMRRTLHGELALSLTERGFSEVELSVERQGFGRNGRIRERD